MERKLARATTPRMPCSPSTVNSLNALNEVLDSSRSSPIGTALMERRAQRQSTRMSPRAGAVSMEVEEVQR